MPNKVFISYRREDSRYQARRVYDAFVHALPPDTVFMDVDSIPPGADFVEILEGWVQQCDVLLALIGPNWLNSIDPRTGLRRVDSPDDFVRIEVRGALQRNIPVVPVLLDATEMPTAAELPDDIKALRRRHAEFVDFRTFDADVQRLIKRLKIGKRMEPSGETPRPLAKDNVVFRPIIRAVNAFIQWIEQDAAAAKSVLFAAGAGVLLLFAVGSAAYVLSGGTPVDSAGRHVDASAGLADLAKSEEARRAAEARAGKASDALAVAEKARQDAEAAQTKSEEARRAAETRAGEASEALTKIEKARQDAEAKAKAAVAALDKMEENRQAAEARAKGAEDAAKKSDKARIEAENRADSAATAQAKAEQGQRAADKARADAEVARTQADSSRQFAEVRANEAAEAQKKSEKARQEAEAKLAAALAKAEESRKVADARTSPGRSLSSGHLLADIGRSRWVMSAEGSCWATQNVNFLSPEVGDGTITWVNGLGNRTTEKIQISFENSFYTDTRSYIRSGDDKVLVTPKGRSVFALERCP